VVSRLTAAKGSLAGSTLNSNSVRTCVTS
jgi:hypothetical protein